MSKDDAKNRDSKSTLPEDKAGVDNAKPTHVSPYNEKSLALFSKYTLFVTISQVEAPVRLAPVIRRVEPHKRVLPNGKLVFEPNYEELKFLPDELPLNAIEIKLQSPDGVTAFGATAGHHTTFNGPYIRVDAFTTVDLKPNGDRSQVHACLKTRVPVVIHYRRYEKGIKLHAISIDPKSFTLPKDGKLKSVL